MSKDSEKGKYKTPEGSYTWEYLSTFVCTLFMLCIGTVVGWNSPILGKLLAPDSPIPLTPVEVSTMAALVSLGHSMGPPLTMVIVDRLGRKTSLLIAGAPLIVSWGLIIVAKYAVVLFIARFIAGLSLGLAYCICPIYLGEIASPKLRGGNGMLFTIMFNSGVLFMMVIVPYLTVRVSAAISMAIATSFLIGMWFMPESPYFLAMIGKTEEAESALELLRGKTDVSDELELIKLTLVQKNIQDPEVTKETNKEITPKKTNVFLQLLTVKGNFKAMCIVLIFSCSHHFGGFVTIMIYGHIVFTAMGIGIESHICTIVVAVLQFISTIVASFLIDRLGRKPLTCFSGVLSGICLVIIGTYFYLMEHTQIDVKEHAIVPFSAAFVLVIAANLGLMPIQNVILSEIFHTDIKALASCLFGVISGLISTFTVKSYPLMVTSWGFGHSVPFLSFAVITWACTASLMWLLPETKGKCFLQIQKDLNA